MPTLTPERILAIATEAAGNVASGGACSAEQHNIKTIRMAIEQALAESQPKEKK